MIKLLRSTLAIGLSIIAVEAWSATIIYSDQSTFAAAVPATTLYDFETASGFPTGGAGAASYVGNRGGVTFVGVTHPYSGDQALSGVAVGFSCCFGIGAIDFTSLPTKPNAVGFYGLDLTAGEIIRVNVGFSDGTNANYSIDLGAAPDFTEIFFGLVDTARRVNVIQLFGANAGTPDVADRAWLIDDLEITNVPLPGAWALLATGMAIVAGRARRRGTSIRV